MSTTTVPVQVEEVVELRDLQLSEPETPHPEAMVSSDTEHATGTAFDALPPADHGKGAYLALACCTLAQAPIWGSQLWQYILNTKADMFQGTLPHSESSNNIS